MMLCGIGNLLGKMCHLKSLLVHMIMQMWTLTYNVMRYYALSKAHQLIDPQKTLNRKIIILQVGIKITQEFAGKSFLCLSNPFIFLSLGKTHWNSERSCFLD